MGGGGDGGGVDVFCAIFLTNSCLVGFGQLTVPIMITIKHFCVYSIIMICVVDWEKGSFRKILITEKIEVKVQVLLAIVIVVWLMTIIIDAFVSTSYIVKAVLQ